MPFPPAVREAALTASGRGCCLCKVFRGRDVTVHHIVPEADGGANDPENAIVLCLKCHSEAGHYNPRHPLGSKYSPAELRHHRDKWLRWVEEHPDLLDVPLLDSGRAATRREIAAYGAALRRELEEALDPLVGPTLQHDQEGSSDVDALFAAIRDGAAAALLGRSGTGKSHLARHLALRALSPDLLT